MSNVAPQLGDISDESLLSDWVLHGVKLFIQQSQMSSPACSQLVQQQSTSTLFRELSKGWKGLCGWMKKRLQGSQGLQGSNSAIGRLSQDMQLDDFQLFVFGLSGEVEQHHLLAIAISELQSSEQQSWPTVHLLVAMGRSLFPHLLITATSIHKHPLVSNECIRLVGDVPLVLKSLIIDPDLYSGLTQTSSSFMQQADCHVERETVQTFKPVTELVTMFQLNRQTHALIHSSYEDIMPLIAAAATSQSKQIITIRLSQWIQRPALALLCQYRKVIPVIDCHALDKPVSLPSFSFYSGVVFLIAESHIRITAQNLRILEIPKPDSSSRETIWQEHLNDKKNHENKLVDRAQQLAHAHLAEIQIKNIVQQARRIAILAGCKLKSDHIQKAWSQLSKEQMGTLAQLVERRIDKEALVLPDKLQQQLDNLVLRCKRRETLWQGLGVTAQGSENYGVRCLFLGDSGTGKTLCASHLASELGMPLYRMDLSSIMDKYIGETEKNLNRLFDHASSYDVILLLDEVDALAGQRTNGDEPGARFANMLTNYLLTRIETYPGIIVLTSNSRSRIDSAFMRRIDTTIEFPLPHYEERLRLWENHLGVRSPGNDICKRLASECELSGGAIRNIVLAAAVRNHEIRAIDLLDALEAEYRKLGQSMPIEIQHWQQAEESDNGDT